LRPSARDGTETAININSANTKARQRLAGRRVLEDLRVIGIPRRSG
jgi:hypothetical protein